MSLLITQGAALLRFRHFGGHLDRSSLQLSGPDDSLIVDIHDVHGYAGTDPVFRFYDGRVGLCLGMGPVGAGDPDRNCAHQVDEIRNLRDGGRADHIDRCCGSSCDAAFRRLRFLTAEACRSAGCFFAGLICKAGSSGQQAVHLRVGTARASARAGFSFQAAGNPCRHIIFGGRQSA